MLRRRTNRGTCSLERQYRLRTCQRICTHRIIRIRIQVYRHTTRYKCQEDKLPGIPRFQSTTDGTGSLSRVTDILGIKKLSSYVDDGGSVYHSTTKVAIVPTVSTNTPQFAIWSAEHKRTIRISAASADKQARYHSRSCRAYPPI